MKDRIPMSPGMHIAELTSENLEKLQNGKQFRIFLYRDDDPVETGTPYNKAAVLPDSVAGMICPDIEDPTPADAFRAVYLEAVRHPQVNLLDNSNFKNPINQRGGNLYTGAGYLIDRWKMAYTGLEVTVNEDNLYLQSTVASGVRGISQLIEARKTPKAEQVVTVAYKLVNDNEGIYVGSCPMPASGSYKDVARASGAGAFVRITGANSDGCGTIAFVLEAERDAAVEWIAFYEGAYTAETLPPYRPKSYTEEMLECQRYFINLGTVAGFGYVYSASIAYVSIVTPVRMRINPTITASDDLGMTIRCAGQKHSVKLGSVSYLANNQIRIALDISGLSLPVDEPVHVVKSAGMLEFSADL